MRSGDYQFYLPKLSEKPYKQVSLVATWTCLESHFHKEAHKGSLKPQGFFFVVVAVALFICFVSGTLLSEGV